MGQLERLEACMSDGSVWRARDLALEGITATTVARALAAGRLERVSRGTYRLAGAPHAEGEQLAEAAVRAPRGVVCLHSAAAAHGLGDVEPARVWVALPHSLKPPRLEWPVVRWIRWRSPAAFETGVEERLVCGVRVRLTGRARTVVDMLRMRGAVGEDRALECLRDYFEAGGSPGELGSVAAALGAGRGLSPLLRSAAVLARAA